MKAIAKTKIDAGSSFDGLLDCVIIGGWPA